MFTKSLLSLALCAALSSCATTGGGSGGGGGDRYHYPESKAAKAKTVKFASTDGRFVGLSDGSLWNIDWSNTSAARNLRPGTPVSVRNVGSGSFPYQLSTPGAPPVRARFGKKLD